MQNTSGDYWQKTVRIKPGLEMQYKYWTGHSKTVPTFVRLGWEGPVTPYDSIAGNYRKFIAGTNDTIIDIEYYNPAGTSVTQFWRPFIHKTDSVAVFLKVSMAGVTSTGRFNPANNGPVGVRGGAVNNINIMAWDNTRPILVREQYSIRNGAFWSGTAYYPVSLSGMEQPYKFFIEGDTGNGWENSISNRTFTVPQADTTIYWVNFDNQPIVGVEDNAPVETGGFRLIQNYPNPFNNSTRISYYLPAAGFIEVTIYNVAGQKLSTLVHEFQNPGNYSTDWTGRDDAGNIVPSGIYYIQCKSPNKIETLKAVLLK
ncbi:MAG: T9SS type A sorting domain-containing protein [Ignavibacteriales bacterium]|nr:T9SS type A sorting domain-containing protein [Ignavibacteriales bacterium]